MVGNLLQLVIWQSLKRSGHLILVEGVRKIGGVNIFQSWWGFWFFFQPLSSTFSLLPKDRLFYVSILDLGIFIWCIPLGRWVGGYFIFHGYEALGVFFFMLWTKFSWALAPDPWPLRSIKPVLPNVDAMQLLCSSGSLSNSV